MARIDPHTAPSYHLAFLVKESLVEVMRAALQMPARLKTPIPNETRTDHLVYVTHALYQSIDQAVLRDHDHFCFLLDRAIQFHFFHRELFE